MKLDNLNRWLTLLANLGVLGGIVLLAIEVQQTTEAQQARLRFDQNERSTEVIEEYFRNPQLAAAYVKLVNQEPLTREEAFILSALALRVFRSLEWIHEEAQRNGVERDPGDLRDLFYHSALGGYDFPFLVFYWDENKAGVSPDFRQWVEENIIDQAASK